jgi:hypothetical protein
LAAAEEGGGGFAGVKGLGGGAEGAAGEFLEFFFEIFHDARAVFGVAAGGVAGDEPSMEMEGGQFRIVDAMLF